MHTLPAFFSKSSVFVWDVCKKWGTKMQTSTRKRYFLRTVLESSANNDVFTSKIIKNRLWALWGSFGVVWGSLGRPWEGSGETLGTFGETLGGFWKTLGGFGEALGRLWEALGRLWEDFPTDRPTAPPTIYSNSRSTELRGTILSVWL